jgi:hypothetical protein
MKTYLTIMFDSEGARPSEVAEILYNLGFTAVQGNYDFVYNWGRSANIKDIIWFGDKIHSALKGYRVLFKLETVI